MSHGATEKCSGKNMSTQFKGVAGGDPSRHPPRVIVNFYCVICNKPGSAETKRANHFTPPKTCSSDCAAALVRKEAEDLIRYALGRTNAPSLSGISQRVAEEVISAHNWMGQAEVGAVRKIRITCAHCEKETENFTTHRHSNTHVSKFCSWVCKASNAAGLPTGVICRSPRKMSHRTLEEAQRGASDASAMLLLKGDMEGVTPYLCSCGKWHVGHKSKAAWLLPAEATIAYINGKTLTVIQQRKSLRRKNK
jgi:hypothetical protein